MINNFIKKFKKLIFTFGILLASDMALAKGMPKEYYNIKNSKESKEYFFDYMYKLIEKENLKILEERDFVKRTLSSNILTLDHSSMEFKKLLEIKKKYKIKKLYTYNEYIKKIDVIPPSQALAQAAVESGWGKSRFIKKANNIFGHWTYNPKIGMVPEKRTPGARHLIRVFSTLEDSISAYMLNLNRNYAYKSFREKRYNLRLKKINPDGLSLSQTMVNYSGIGHDYLSILKNVINSNKLNRYDKKFYMKVNTN